VKKSQTASTTEKQMLHNHQMSGEAFSAFRPQDSATSRNIEHAVMRIECGVDIVHRTLYKPSAKPPLQHSILNREEANGIRY